MYFLELGNILQYIFIRIKAFNYKNWRLIDLKLIDRMNIDIIGIFLQKNIVVNAFLAWSYTTVDVWRRKILISCYSIWTRVCLRTKIPPSERNKISSRGRLVSWRARADTGNVVRHHLHNSPYQIFIPHLKTDTKISRSKRDLPQFELLLERQQLLQ
jgi:hypothetical protein